jgi:hypothetical protein
MIVSAVMLGIAGIAAIFAPAELLSSIGLGDIAPPVLVQLLGALYFAFAMTNWTAKDNAIGGIYSRPLALGNFAHFMIGTLVLVRPVIALPRVPLILAFVIYLVFALLFGALLFGQGPVGKSSNAK